VRLIAAILSVWLLSSLSHAATLKGAVTSPVSGVICDKKAGFCADASGISMGLTKEYLGEGAEQKLLAQGEFDLTAFVLTNGVACDTKSQKCTKGKWDKSIDTAHTKALFGK
jgi:hypothetical protein